MKSARISRFGYNATGCEKSLTRVTSTVINYIYVINIYVLMLT